MAKRISTPWRFIVGIFPILMVIAALAVLGNGCAPPSAAPTSGAQDDGYWPTGEWRISTPEEHDMDPLPLNQMMALIDEQGFAYDAALVVRHGHVVFEAYRNGYNQDTRHHLQSATKSFSSMLIGIALHEGFIDDVGQKVVDLFPDHAIANMDARKGRLTLEHLLTMSDGMDWHELDYPYTDARNTLGQMWRSRDAVQHVLDRPMAREPGEAWAYNSGTSILLGGIIEQTTGRDVLSFAREVLFDPIGIGDVDWQKTTGDHYHTDGGLYLTPRDMARFGYLMLHGGTWDGKQIVPREWVARSTETHYQTGMGKGYGYQWWTFESGIYAAQGHYEQKIYVVPGADMVVVFTGDIPDDVLPPTDGLLYGYILAACTDLPPEATRQTYTNYGFTFSCPAGFSVAEMPFPGREAVSAAAGLVQFRFDAYPFELIQAVWVETEPDLDLKAYLAEAVRSASQQAGVTYTVGESRAWTQDEHQALHQTFNFAQREVQMRGAIVAWYCDESERVYLFTYLTNPEVSDQDLTARFQKHLDSFACHGTRQTSK